MFKPFAPWRRSLQGVTLFALLTLLACAGVRPATAAGALDLRCEYLVNPLGIHETAPRLGWRMNSSRRAEKQTAYQVLVASTPEMLGQQKGDLWDSGKVASERSAHIEYAGKPLQSRMRCFWTVRVWDRDGKPGAWSKSALWSMGLTNASDWSAQWLAAPPLTQPASGQQKIEIIKATYEAVDGAGARDVTGLLTGMLKGGGVNVQVNNQALGGDPAYQHVKQLRVEFDSGGKRQNVTARENETFNLQDGARALPYLRK